jgi:hypothetical protein
MLNLLNTIAAFALPPSRCRLKLAVRGGILRLTGDELSVGMGFLGSRDVRRLPLAAIVAVEDEPGVVPADGVTLRVITADDDLAIAGVSPLSARRLRAMLRTLRAQPIG